MLQSVSIDRIVCLATALFVASSDHVFAIDDAAKSAAAPSQAESRPESITVQTITDAWKLTEAKVRTAVFEWNENRVITKNLLLEDETMTEASVPQYTVTNRLAFEDKKLRFTYKKSSWTSEAPENGDQYVGVFNGKNSKVYLPPGYVSGYPRGHVGTRGQSEELTSAYLKPLLWAFRPSLPRVTLFPIADAKLLPTREEVEDHECLVLEFSGHPGERHNIVVDPSQDFSIVRQNLTINNRLKFQLKIKYERNASFGISIPKSWKYESFNSAGDQQFSVASSLASYSINPVLAASEFEFDFPVGTWVHDGRNTEYIVTADGPTRTVGLRERQVPYAELLREPGLSPEATRWFFWCNLLLLLAISGFLLFRWHQWKRAIPH